MSGGPEQVETRDLLVSDIPVDVSPSVVVQGVVWDFSFT